MNIELYKKSLKERGWTYKDLARETGISLTNISRIMAGIVKEPRHSTVESIEKALGVNVSYITSEERAAGARETIKRSVTPIEDELLYAFEVIGQKLGVKGQRALIDVAESMAGIK